MCHFTNHYEYMQLCTCLHKNTYVHTSYNIDHINFRCIDKQTKLYAVISWPTYVSVYTGPSSINSVNSETCLNDIMLSWNVMSDLMACGPVSYTVTITSDGMMIYTTDTSHDFTGLIPGTDYTVSIESSNMAGSGQAYSGIIRTAPNSKC